MQEEIESRTVNLAVSTTKLTARTVVSAVMMYLRHRKLVKDLKANEVPSGKQSVKDLLGQNQGVSNIDIAKTDLKGFEGVDLAEYYNQDCFFFKAKDADAMTAAFNEYSAKTLARSKKPSVLKQLRSIAAKVAELPGKVVNRDKKRELDR